MNSTEILIPISFFALVYGIVYLLVRRKERMALIEKGVSAELLESSNKTPSSLKWGMLFVGVGLGLLIGRILGELTCLGEEEAVFSMILLLGGFSLILYHIIASRMEKNPPRE